MASKVVKPLRVLQNAAALKRDDKLFYDLSHSFSPRSSERGCIEARGCGVGYEGPSGLSAFFRTRLH